MEGKGTGRPAAIYFITKLPVPGRGRGGGEGDGPTSGRLLQLQLLAALSSGNILHNKATGTWVGEGWRGRGRAAQRQAAVAATPGGWHSVAAIYFTTKLPGWGRSGGEGDGPPSGRLL
jgi:hypothetical protein